VKRGIVNGLEWLCGLLDSIPVWERDNDGKLIRAYGAFGCGWLRLCQRSIALDKRWQTGVYGHVTD
jgi:hypothetical protein